MNITSTINTIPAQTSQQFTPQNLRLGLQTNLKAGTTKSKQNWLVGIGVGFALVTVLILVRQPILDLLAILRDREAIQAYVSGIGVWGPVILSLIQLLQVIIAAIPGQPFLVLAGYMYGFPIGLMINLVGSVVASQLAFILARAVGRPVPDRLVPSAVLERWLPILDQKGLAWLFIFYLVPIFPTDMLNYIAGVSLISPKRFLITTGAGRLPYLIIITLIGSHGLTLPIYAWGILGGVILISVCLVLIYRYAIRKQPLIE